MCVEVNNYRIEFHVTIDSLMSGNISPLSDFSQVDDES